MKRPYGITFEIGCRNVDGKRKSKYPPVGNQLDEILRFLNTSEMELTLGLQKVIADWEQVKIDIPKPG